MQFSTFPLESGHLFRRFSTRALGTIPKWTSVDPAEELSPSCQRWKWLNLALFEPSDASLLYISITKTIKNHFFGMIDGCKKWRSCYTVVKKYEGQFVMQRGDWMYCLVWVRSCAYSVLVFAFLEDTLVLPAEMREGFEWDPVDDTRFDPFTKKLRWPHPQVWSPSSIVSVWPRFPRFWGFKSLDAWFSADQGWGGRCWLLTGVKVAF